MTFLIIFKFYLLYLIYLNQVRILDNPVKTERYRMASQSYLARQTLKSLV